MKTRREADRTEFWLMLVFAFLTAFAAVNAYVELVERLG